MCFQLTASLDGTVADDGLPVGGSLTTAWAKRSDRDVTFGNRSQADTSAAFSKAGTYVLRLTANDGTLSASDDINVMRPRQISHLRSNAGPDVTITLPATASINGTATDDERPPEEH